MTATQAKTTIERIAAQLQGYDPQALSASAVAAFLQQLGEPLTETENLPLLQCLGRVLAQDVVSPIDVPARDNSAMDGYAFSGAPLLALDKSNTAPDDLHLQVVGTALAGIAWQGTVSAGQCVKIMTGAIMPSGCDTVVPQEFTRLGASENTIAFARTLLKVGDNRRCQGEDTAQGSVALTRGSKLTAPAVGLIASLGLDKACVFRRLKVAYFSTGDEVLNPGEPLRDGALYDSNRFTMLNYLQQLGCEAIDMGKIGDDPIALEQAFSAAAARADVVITSGGVSVGEADHTKTMMKKLGDVAFWRVAMRPGRPMAVGRVGDAVLFGLPGNPVAVVVTYLAFVRPALLRLMGSNQMNQPLIQARSLEAMRKKAGRTEYQRGIVSLDDQGQLVVRTTGNQGSGVLSSVVNANGLIVLAHEQGNVEVGDMLNVMLFDAA